MIMLIAVISDLLKTDQAISLFPWINIQFKTETKIDAKSSLPNDSRNLLKEEV